MTYSFCKEFVQVLHLHVGSDGDLGVTEVMKRIFEKSGKARYGILIICGQSYKHFMLVNYDSRVVIWGIFQSGMTLES